MMFTEQKTKGNFARQCSFNILLCQQWVNSCMVYKEYNFMNGPHDLLLPSPIGFMFTHHSCPYCMIALKDQYNQP